MQRIALSILSSPRLLFSELPFGLSSATLDIHWRNLCKLAGVEGLHFHDLRATAATRLSKKLNILQLARMLGHKDTKMLMIYFRETAEDVAKLL